MVRYLDRKGNELNWDTAGPSTFGTVVTNGLYGVDDVIDIMLLGKKGTLYSADPAKLKKYYDGYNNDVKDASWRPICQGNSEQPIPFKELSRDDMHDLCSPAIDDAGGAWENNDSTFRKDYVNTRDYLDGFNWDAAKRSDSNIQDRCSEFFILRNRISEMTDVMAARGYQLFHPENLNHYQNWAGYHPDRSGSKYSCYLVVFYITLPKLLQSLAFFRGPDPPSAIQSLARIQNNNLMNLVNDKCSSVLPESTRLTPGTYYVGTTIYSSDSRYKFVVQPDGNCVVYSYKGDAVWSSNTSNVGYVFPKLYITDDCAAYITSSYTQDSLSDQLSKREIVFLGFRIPNPIAPITMVPSIGVSGYLQLDSSGVLVMRDNAWNIIRWSSVNGTDGSLYDNAANIKIYNTFMPNKDYKASDNNIRYSPSMGYFLKFSPDGVLSLNRVGSVYPNTRKEMVLWDTSSKTSGHPDALLSIQPDGNVVIYSDSKKSRAIWDSGTWNYKNSVFLAADDNGYAVIYGDKGYKGGYPAISVISANIDNPYQKLASGLQANALSNVQQSFERPCSTPKLYGDSVDAIKLANAQGKYCATGLNLITDPRCAIFLSEDLPNGKDSPNYPAFQNYIRPKVDLICQDGYDKSYPEDPSTQKAVNEFCSCKNPAGDSKTIMGQGYNPICYDQKCIDKGYKTSNTLASRSACPKALCITDAQLKNLQVVNNVKISCNASATDSTGTTSVATSIPVSATSDPTGTTSVATSIPVSATSDQNNSNTSASDLPNGNNIGDGDSDNSSDQTNSQTKLIIGIVVGIVALLLLIVLAIKSNSSSRSNRMPFGFSQPSYQQTVPMYQPAPIQAQAPMYQPSYQQTVPAYQPSYQQTVPMYQQPAPTQVQAPMYQQPAPVLPMYSR